MTNQRVFPILSGLIFCFVVFPQAYAGFSAPRPSEKDCGESHRNLVRVSTPGIVKIPRVSAQHVSTSVVCNVQKALRAGNVVSYVGGSFEQFGEMLGISIPTPRVSVVSSSIKRQKLKLKLPQNLVLHKKLVGSKSTMRSIHPVTPGPMPVAITYLGAFKPATGPLRLYFGFAAHGSEALAETRYVRWVHYQQKSGGNLKHPAPRLSGGSSDCGFTVPTNWTPVVEGQWEWTDELETEATVCEIISRADENVSGDYFLYQSRFTINPTQYQYGNSLSPGPFTILGPTINLQHWSGPYSVQQALSANAFGLDERPISLADAEPPTTNGTNSSSWSVGGGVNPGGANGGFTVNDSNQTPDVVTRQHSQLGTTLYNVEEDFSGPGTWPIPGNPPPVSATSAWYSDQAATYDVSEGAALGANMTFGYTTAIQAVNCNYPITIPDTIVMCDIANEYVKFNVDVPSNQLVGMPTQFDVEPRSLTLAPSGPGAKGLLSVTATAGSFGGLPWGLSSNGVTSRVPLSLTPSCGSTNAATCSGSQFMLVTALNSASPGEQYSLAFDTAPAFAASAVEGGPIDVTINIAPAPHVTSVKPSNLVTGPGTGTLTVGGSGFTYANQVDIGSMQMPPCPPNPSVQSCFTVVSDSEITASVHFLSAPGTYDVRVVSPSGTSPITQSDQLAVVLGIARCPTCGPQCPPHCPNP